MKNKIKNVLMVVGIMALFCYFSVSCTENARAKAYGGTMTVDLPENTKFVNATWKDGGQLWYVTRPARPGEPKEVYTFQEKSTFGLVQGKVIFQEK